MSRYLLSITLLAAMVAAHAPAFAQALGMQAAATVDPIDLRVSRAPESVFESQRATASALTPSMLGFGHDYKIGSHDVIEVEIYELDNLKRTVRVSAGGTVSLPLIGQVGVAGLTAQEAQDRIADRYRERYLQNPQVSLFVKEFTTQRITVEGAVTKPGIFPLAGQMTLLRALAMAGGFGPIANTHEVMLFRVDEDQKRQATVFDVNLIRSGKADDPVIRGDDLIVVQQDGTRKVLRDSVFRDLIDSINPFSAFGR